MMLTGILCCGALIQACAGMSAISGTVLDADQHPIAGAQVFVEPGLAGQLRRTTSDAVGAFAFEDVMPGAVGVFAIAPGKGFGGLHVNVAVADEVPPMSLVLYPASSISGKISDPKGNPIAGARITRAALQGRGKVGIPFAKLAAFGFEEPISAADGTFSVPNLPEGEQVALKAGHPLYAQEAVWEVPVGAEGYAITMYQGVLLEGTVLTRAQRTPVARASVLVANAQPPQDTSVASTNAFGEFSLRVKPGVYLCQAAASGLQSPAWERLTVLGDAPRAKVQLLVAGSGSIRGALKNASTGLPIAGARLLLEYGGSIAAMVRTGTTGEYRFDAAEGANIVRFEVAPGFLAPASTSVGVQIAEGQEVHMPDMWLAPIPAFRAQVLDSAGAPVSGAAITLLRPLQFGWTRTDDSGWVQLAVGQVPPEGAIIGIAEHPARREGALFSLREDASGGGRIQLFPLSRLSGKAVSSIGTPAGGCIVGGVFPGEKTGDELVLWMGITKDDGSFSWDSLVPGVPQRMVVWSGDSAAGESALVNTEPGGAVEIENVTVDPFVPGSSIVGQTLDLAEFEPKCGPLLEKRGEAKVPTLALFCEAAEAEAVISGLAYSLRPWLAEDSLRVAVVVEGSYVCNSAPFPVLSGEAPGTATMYLMTRESKVVFECFGMPPLDAFRMLTGS